MMYKTAREQFNATWGKMLQHRLDILQNTRFLEKAIPFIFLGVLFLAFGLTISSLGIYQDDWVFVYNAYARGPQGLWSFLNADGTPFSSFMNITLFYALGFKPLYWHLAALLARWLTVTVFWMVLRRLWPANFLQNFFVALLFGVYPFFTLQPLAFTFLHVWISYFFLGLSFYWMILSVQRPQRFWLYLVLSLAAGIITELTLEYFMGLELLRPVLLWFVLRDQEADIKRRLVRILKLWVPYLIVFAIYVWWRFFIYVVPIENRNNPVGLQLLFSDPMAELRILLSNIVPDVLTMIVATWYKVVDPLFFDLADRTSLLFILVSIVAGVGIFLIFNKRESQQEESQSASPWIREALLLGGIIVLVGLIPPYVAGLFINEKNPLWNSRFGLASMLGAALVIVAFLEWAISKSKTRILLIAVLIGLSVGYHARYTNDFRWSWKKQLNLYRQLVVRIPALRPNTAIVADGEVLFYMGDYPTAYAINTLYSKPLSGQDGPVDYWYFGIVTNFGDNIGAFMDGMDIQGAHRSVTFTGRSDQSIIISFEPDAGQCLYIIRPQDATFRKLPPLLKEASHLSALDRIESSRDSSSPFLDAIGVHYPEDWCTYYQKADLARQNEDYEKVIELWRQAQEKGFSPGASFEYMLFLEAYTKLGRWDDAAGFTFDAVHMFPILRRPMCDYWDTIPTTPETAGVLDRVESELECPSN